MPIIAMVAASRAIGANDDFHRTADMRPREDRPRAKRIQFSGIRAGAAYESRDQDGRRRAVAVTFH